MVRRRHPMSRGRPPVGFQQSMVHPVAEHHVAENPAEPRGTPPQAAQAIAEGGVPFTVAVIVVSLLAFGAGAFFVTQWESTPRMLRLGVFIGAFVAAYGGAWVVLRRRGLVPEVGHALVLSAVGLFGPALLITAQMFSAVGRLPDAVAVWMAMSLLAAAVVPSRPPLWLALFLAVVWSFLEIAAFEAPLHLLFLPAWGGCVVVALWRGWRMEVRVAAALLTLWYGLAGLGMAVNSPWSASAVAALFVLPPAALWGLASAGRMRRLAGAVVARHGAVIGVLGALTALGLVPPLGIAPPAGWLVPALVGLVCVAIGMAVQLSVCGPSRDMVLIAAAALLAVARPWLPGLPALIGVPAPAAWVVPALTLLLAVGFAVWGLISGQRFVAGAASMAAAVQGVAWAMMA